MSEFDMLRIENDNLILGYLEQLGIDTQYSVQYIPSQHRNLQNKVVVGFQAIGEIQCNRKFLNSAYCLPIERIAAYGYQDRSLTAELASLSGTQLNHDAFHEGHINENVEDPYIGEWVEPTYLVMENQIAALAGIRDNIRGPMFDDSGSPKMREQYKAWLEGQL
jgi:hypothetical protein